MSEPLRITFSYSPAEYAAAQWESDVGRKRRLFFRVGGAVIGGLPFLLVVPLGVIAGQSFGPLLRSWLPILPLGAFWLFGAQPLLDAIVARQYRRTTHDMERLEFSDAGFAPSAEWREPMPWSFIDRIAETERFLCIHHGYSKEPVCIPKRALSEDDLERLRSLLQRQLTSRSGNAILLP